MRKTLVALVCALVVAFPGATGALADSGPRTLSYLIGTDFLCGLDASACPAITMAPNGDTIEITGSGTFSIHPKAATGGGTFTHKKSNGDLVGAGTWTADDLLAFHSYGSGAAQGLPPELEGGLVVLRVTLWVDGTLIAEGTLKVTCDLGDKVPAGADEGVRLNVPGLNFNKEVSGFTVYIS